MWESPTYGSFRPRGRGASFFVLLCFLRSHYPGYKKSLVKLFALLGVGPTGGCASQARLSRVRRIGFAGIFRFFTVVLGGVAGGIDGAVFTVYLVCLNHER